MHRLLTMPKPTIWLTALAVSFGATVVAFGCLPDDAEPRTHERYDACLVGFECANECPSPEDILKDLGCSEGDDAMPPNCKLEDSCADLKTGCFADCEDMFPTNPDGSRPPEQTDCKVDCDAEFGNTSPCKDRFQDWLDARDAALIESNNCYSVCEGRPSSNDCRWTELGQGGDTDGEMLVDGCDDVQKARHTGVEKASSCASVGKDCDWRCDNPNTGFPKSE